MTTNGNRVKHMGQEIHPSQVNSSTHQQVQQQQIAAPQQHQQMVPQQQQMMMAQPGQQMMMPAMPDIAFVSSAAQQAMAMIMPIVANFQQNMEGQIGRITISIRSEKEES